VFGVQLTADWPPTREPGSSHLHRVERRLVRVWRDWHEAALFLVAAASLSDKV